MSDNDNHNEHGNHHGGFTQGVGGWAEYTVHMTDTKDTVRHDVTVPPGVTHRSILGSSVHPIRGRETGIVPFSLR